MKHIAKLTLLFAILISFPFVASAKKASADILLKNGTVYSDVSLKLPNGDSKKIEFEKDGRKTAVKSDSIENIILWHNANPENKIKIVYLKWGEFFINEKDRKKHDYGPDGPKNKKWFIEETVGNHMTYLVGILFLDPNKKSIDIRVTSPPHFFKKKTMDHAVIIPSFAGIKRKVREWLATFLADDETLCNDITDQGYFNKKAARRQGGNLYNPFFYEDIAADYTPGRKKLHP